MRYDSTDFLKSLKSLGKKGSLVLRGPASSASFCCIAQILVALHNHFGHYLSMAIYWPNVDDRRSLDRCAICEATVVAEVACAGWADANTVCGSCGKTQVDSPFEGGDYFDVIMRVGRPTRAARLGRAE